MIIAYCLPYQSLRELFSHFRLLESFPFDIKSVIKRYLKKTRKTYPPGIICRHFPERVGIRSPSDAYLFPIG